MEDKCNIRCMFALSSKCRCKCGGVGHGQGWVELKARNEEKELCEFYPSMEEDAPVCGKGSDISGHVCTTDDQKKCQWAKE